MTSRSFGDDLASGAGQRREKLRRLKAAVEAHADEIVAAVKAKGVPVEYIVFDDEGHGFVKKENEIEGYGAVLKFLDTHLRGRPMSP